MVAAKLDDVADRLIFPSFSRLGPSMRRRVFDWADVDVGGRRIAITGPTSGIGLATAHRLAQAGAELILIARNPEKAARLQAELAASTTTKPSVIVADLSSLQSVRNAGSQLATLERLDGLIHNGGGLHEERQLTEDGIELTFATHVVAPFLLTSLATPALVASPDARVITVSSGGMYTQPLDLDDLQSEVDYDGSKTYAKAKRAQVILNQQAAERSTNPNIAFHAMHPGWVRTPGLSDALPRFSQVLKPFLRSPEQGCDTIVWLSGVDVNEVGSGHFWLDRRKRPIDYLSKTVTDTAEHSRLWSAVERLAGLSS